MMYFRVVWKSHDDPDAGHVNIEARDEQDAKAIAWARLQKHYEDELHELGIQIVSVTAHDKVTKTPDADEFC